MAPAVEVVERLDAETIASDQETPALPIPEREAVHAVERVREVIAVLLVGVDDDLGVAASAEAMPGALEPRSELAKVVDLAVADDPDALVLVGDRLMAAGEVDDRQAAHAEQHLAVQVVAVIVGAAMGRDRAHPRMQ